MAPNRLQAFLAWAGWTHAHLADLLGIHQTSVSRLLSGKRAPGVEVAVALERLTAEPRETGDIWPDGPLRIEEWVHSPSVITEETEGRGQ